MTMQDYLAGVTEKAATDLFTAYLRLPEEKRKWAPSALARSAHDQVVECAQLNAATVMLLEKRQWLGTHESYENEKNQLTALSTEELKTTLEANAALAIAAIRAVADDSLAEVIPLPWGPETVTSICGFAYWNMTYHTGQINEITLTLGIDF